MSYTRTVGDLILSASRRTDLPAHYPDYLLGGLKEGRFTFTHPWTKKKVTVEAPRERIHSVVLWSRDFGPILSRWNELEGRPLTFQFTITPDDPLLQPHVPPAKRAVGHMAELARLCGPETITWRMDPLLLVRRDGVLRTNGRLLARLAGSIRGTGVTRCVLSFVDRYRKVEKRVARLSGIDLLYPEGDRAERILRVILPPLLEYGFHVSLCCEPNLTERYPDLAAPCIDGEHLVHLFGPGPILRQDPGQRKACLCQETKDVGSYLDHPCPHGCLYCYANPVASKGHTP